MHADVLIIGAGVSGLSCAAALAARGRQPIVLERAMGVGGRCATRRLDGQPVDHGVTFLHGSDAKFVAALRAVDARVVDGWPQRVVGSGTPCQPRAFADDETRLAFAEGVSAFPKHLAQGLDVRCNRRVDAIECGARSIEVRTENGERFQTTDLVLALAIEQARKLLARVEVAGRALLPVQALLDMVGSRPCLSMIATYGTRPAPVTDLWLPEDSPSLQLVAHDSAKRVDPARLVLVLQAHAKWSTENLTRPTAEWSRELLEESRRVIGPWAGQPDSTHPHTWRYARVDRGCEFSSPLITSLANGSRISHTGELFAPQGGVEAAFGAGRALARRLVQEAHS